MWRIMLAGALAGLCASSGLAADRASAAIDCKPAGKKFAYDCTIKLTNARTAAPVEKAEVTVSADMPSMPMAHNVRPVLAKPAGRPGEYEARLQLEMFGDWAVRLKITGPLADQLVQMRNFGESGSGPPARKAGAPGGGHKR
jgi:hypothetical protein